MIEASIDTFNCDYDKITMILGKITKSITKEKQEDFIEKIATISSPVTKVYNSITENKPLD